MANTKLRKGALAKLGIFFLLSIGIYSAWVIAWSRQVEHLTPVRLGVDVCHHCGMIVSDMRFAVSVLDRDEQGHVVTRHFDDPGCFQSFLKSKPETQWIGVAHDFKTGHEIPLDQASFVKSNETTPMGTGIIVISKKK